ncbi:MAG: sulfur carrier protein ThiS [bacterium]
MPSIILNGEPREIQEGTSVRDLLEGLDLLDRPVAVERNRSIVSRDRFDTTLLEEGDRIEVVSFVPGG